MLKFHDVNGDGQKQESEPGLDWVFDWQKNDDGNWREYKTYAEQSGRGGNVTNLKDNDKIEVRERAKAGWEDTTGAGKTVTIENDKVKRIEFGNRQPAVTPKTVVQASPLPQDQELPKSGSTSQTVGLLSLGVITIGLGAYRIALKKR